MFFDVIGEFDDPENQYQGLNLVAGIFMAIGLLPKNAWFSFTLQIIWALVALIAIIKMKG